MEDLTVIFGLFTMPPPPPTHTHTPTHPHNTCIQFDQIAHSEGVPTALNGPTLPLMGTTSGKVVVC